MNVNNILNNIVVGVNLHAMGKKFWSVNLSIKKAQIFSTVVVPYGVARNPISTRTNVSIILKTTSAEKNLSARKAK